MMHSFRSKHAEFDGFSEYFARDVRPILKDRDAVRQAAVRKGLIGAVLSTAVLLSVSSLIILYFDNPMFGIFLVGLAMMSGFVVFGASTNSIRKETKGRIVSSVVEYIGWTFDADVINYDIRPFAELFLIPNRIDRSSFEDRLSGQAHGAQFHAVEAHFERRTRDSKGKTRWSTIFRGQLMQIQFPTRTYGRTIVLREKGLFQRKKRGDMKRIGLADPVFEKIFEAYGTDQVEGRVILDPAFMQRMVDLEAAVSGKNIRYGFDADTLFIAVETRNQFEAGSMFSPLARPERTQAILDEVGAVFDIVDAMLAAA
ncbi:DUF3137 domain-containing protein [uncultured Algimonas sp.]|uniref:DUF3137 domain-containing protein n=1 Tax=uncultured Algimonas sp. TaxID=1547920 RepID=UPI0026094AD4|nr:DUF3137 domain-containing protein [uncultured Algimonas sp.]